MIRPHERCLGQDIMGEVETGLLQSDFNRLHAGRLAFSIYKTPEDGAAAVHMHPGRHLLDQEMRIQPCHQVLDGEELMFIPHRERLGQFNFRVHISLLMVGSPATLRHPLRHIQPQQSMFIVACAKDHQALLLPRKGRGIQVPKVDLLQGQGVGDSFEHPWLMGQFHQDYVFLLDKVSAFVEQSQSPEGCRP
jgi:hypothetical protein